MPPTVGGAFAQVMDVGGYVIFYTLPDWAYYLAGDRTARTAAAS